MEKRRAEVTPLKKIAYSAEDEESRWWSKTASVELLQKRIEAVYAQMKEYKVRVEELEEEKNKILGARIEEAVGDSAETLAVLRKELLGCEEHMMLISQLRTRLSKCSTPSEPAPSAGSSSLPAVEAVPSSAAAEASEISAAELEELVAKIEKLEERIDLVLSKHPPNYAHLVKTLEIENADMFQTMSALSSRIEAEVAASQKMSNEIQVLAEEKAALSEEIRRVEEQQASATSAMAKEKQVYQQRIDELYLTIEKINSQIIDYGRDLEKENTEITCTPECQKRLKELEGKEIDRIEEVSYLVRHYVDTAKENDALKLALENSSRPLDSAGVLHTPKQSEASEENSLQEKCDRLALELEKSKTEYLERKSSAQYHKRKSVQFEAELLAAKKTIADLEHAHSAIAHKLETLRAQKLPNTHAKEVELYQKMIRCAVCSVNMKNAILRKCMHLMCRECIDKRFQTRHRTCPLCGIAFSLNDISSVYL